MLFNVTGSCQRQPLLWTKYLQLQSSSDDDERRSSPPSKDHNHYRRC
ncbi:hypothetical protein DERP_002702 [Dermatophagoides pteronyssinus]|uniref:Uncharacterized protein n=1 Tax=Dermatophagoides pteronyssinus TaxID=6956 RepID=A0ABQ8JW13_DERPT|nr:hypothetical protein DERP_002702 [Dermatophagoides pteronyssinus]